MHHKANASTTEDQKMRHRWCQECHLAIITSAC